MRRLEPTLADRVELIRRSLNVVHGNASLIARTARETAAPDGYPTGHRRTSVAGADEDVDLNRVESAAVRLLNVSRPNDVYRGYAFAIVEFVAQATELLAQAEEFTHRLADRLPSSVRDQSQRMCANECGRERSHGWDRRHPDGVKGQCQSCYRLKKAG